MGLMKVDNVLEELEDIDDEKKYIEELKLFEEGDVVSDEQLKVRSKSSDETCYKEDNVVENKDQMSFLKHSCHSEVSASGSLTEGMYFVNS